MGQVLVVLNEIVLSCDIIYDDFNVFVKDLEEGLFWCDMNNDLVNQIMCCLLIIKLRNLDFEENDE